MELVYLIEIVRSSCVSIDIVESSCVSIDIAELSYVLIDIVESSGSTDTCNIGVSLAGKGVNCSECGSKEDVCSLRSCAALSIEIVFMMKDTDDFLIF